MGNGRRLSSIERSSAMNVRARAVLVALAAVTLTSAASARPNGAEQQQVSTVSEWNMIAQAETVLLRPTAHGQGRGMAMVEGAVYDAVNAIDRSRKPYLLDPGKVGVAGRHPRMLQRPPPRTASSWRSPPRPGMRAWTRRIRQRSRE